jgi:hypothetical protein
VRLRGDVNNIFTPEPSDKAVINLSLAISVRD